MSPKSKARRGRRRGARKRIAVRPAARTPSDVCFRCGMCCDGTLFATATLEDSELEHAGALGFATSRREDGSTAFAQPCPQFVHGRCGVYVDRPNVCREYRCALLPMYLAGEASLDECLDVIELARGFMGHLEHAMGVPDGSYTATLLEEFIAAVRPNDEPSSHQDSLVPLFQLNQLGVRYFGWTGSPRTPAEAADSARGQVAPARTVAVPRAAPGEERSPAGAAKPDPGA